MTQTTAEQVGANVRAEMARAGLSQAALAAILGLSQPAISKRLRGIQAFDVDEVARAAEALGIDVASLMSITSTSAQAS